MRGYSRQIAWLLLAKKKGKRHTATSAAVNVRPSRTLPSPSPYSDRFSRKRKRINAKGMTTNKQSPTPNDKSWRRKPSEIPEDGSSHGRSQSEKIGSPFGPQMTMPKKALMITIPGFVSRPSHVLL